MRTTIRAAAVAAVLLATGYAEAQVCGDVTDNGKVTATDALSVLQAAVGLDVQLVCDTGDCLALETRMDALEDETLIVADGDGNVLGRLVGGEPQANRHRVFVKPLGKYIALLYGGNPDDSGMESISAPALQQPEWLFSEPDCQGVPFVTENRTDLDENMIAPSPDGRYFIVNGQKAEPYMVASQLVGNGVCIPKTDAPFIGGTRVAFQMKEVALPFDLPAPGPFQIKPLR